MGRYEEMKLFKRYVDGFICTVRGDPDKYLKFANSLHSKLTLVNLEKVNLEGDLDFLDINIIGIKNQLTLE